MISFGRVFCLEPVIRLFTVLASGSKTQMEINGKQNLLGQRKPENLRYYSGLVTMHLVSLSTTTHKWACNFCVCIKSSCSCSWHRTWYSLSSLNILSWVLWETKQQHSQVMAVLTTLVYNSEAQMGQRLTKSINRFAVVEDSYSVGNVFMRGKYFAHY